MKDITKYIGTKTAIHCETQEQFELIINLDPKRFLASGKWIENGKSTCVCIHRTDIGFTYGHIDYCRTEHFSIIPATDFMPEQREIEGWAWKEGYKEKYHQAVCAIVNHHGEYVLDVSTFDEGSEWEQQLKEAGVLELWFQPVYEEAKVWPKDGAPCLVWDNGCKSITEVQIWLSDGEGGFNFGEQNEKSTLWDHHLELTAENIPLLPFKN